MSLPLHAASAGSLRAQQRPNNHEFKFEWLMARLGFRFKCGVCGRMHDPNRNGWHRCFVKLYKAVRKILSKGTEEHALSLDVEELEMIKRLGEEISSGACDPFKVLVEAGLLLSLREARRG